MAHTHPHEHGEQTHTHAHHESNDASHGHVHSEGQTPLQRPHPDLLDGKRRIAYFDCFAGASGDMLLGALLDAGLPLDALRAELGKLELGGYELETERIESHGLTGTRLRVRDTLQEYPARHLHDIHHLVYDSGLAESIKARSMQVVEALGRVEADIHGIPLEEVHFHEIGAVDTIVDIVGFVAGLELLGVERAFASAIPLGTGIIQIAHGRFPAPAPATLALLASVGAPTVPHPAQTEIVTPTGAALLTCLAHFELPPMRVQAVGYGFGSKTFPWPNALRVWLGESDSSSLYQHDKVVELDCNLDDVTGETLGYTMERLFAAGALDVWFTPIQMKKNRPGVLLSVLSPEHKVQELAWILMRETSTLGIRMFPPAHRLKADRRMREVETPWGKVRIKEKWLGDQRLDASPEYEDCAQLARMSGEPIMHVMNVAREIAEQPS